MSVTQLQHWQHLASFPLFVCWIIYKQVPEIMPFDLWVLFFSDSIRWFCIHLKLITMEVISGHSAFTRSSVSVKISTENFQWETQILRRHPLVMDTYFGGSYFLFQPIRWDSKCGHEKREKSRRSILTSWWHEYKVIQHWILSPSSHQAVP